MQIDIQALNFSLTAALRAYIERRLSFSLSSHNDHIRKIVIRLSDINGPRGGADKCCHIQIVIPQLEDIVIDDTETNLYVAINRAADRAGRTAGRRLARHRNIKRTCFKSEVFYDAEYSELNSDEIH